MNYTCHFHLLTPGFGGPARVGGFRDWAHTVFPQVYIQMLQDPYNVASGDLQFSAFGFVY